MLFYRKNSKKCECLDTIFFKSILCYKCYTFGRDCLVFGLFANNCQYYVQPYLGYGVYYKSHVRQFLMVS